jgi:uncharacterized cupin superfamily protein
VSVTHHIRQGVRKYSKIFLVFSALIAAASTGYALTKPQAAIVHGNFGTFKWTPLPKYGGAQAIIYRSPDGRRVAAAWKESGQITYTYPFDEFLVVMSGTAHVSVHGGETFDLKKGDVMVVREGTTADFILSKDFSDVTYFSADHPISWD